MNIQLHTITTLPVHVPNRGGDGLAKKGVYAGIERQRISYQAQQYGLRHALEFCAVENAAELHSTKRTALVAKRLLLPAFQKADINDASAWADAVMALWRKKKDKSKSGNEEEDSRKKDNEKTVPLIVGEQEIKLLTAVVKACAADGTKPTELRDLVEKRPPKDTDERVLAALHALKNTRGSVGTDGALFGRMATGVAVGTVDRCVRFSDALTTHGITPVADFFLTTDDLKDRDAGEAGGSHINSREMSAGVFYRHVVIDTAQMERNGLPPAVVEPLMDALLRVSPIGNRAPARTVDALVEVDGQVRSLMDAFASPVSAPAEAISRLRQFAQNDYDTYGVPKMTLWLSDQSPVRVSSLAHATAIAAGCEVAAVETA